ncbi:MAG: DUF1501 domain-containing protein [Gemmatimonadaceae bacterium]|nr:DUF1501 domain-containing protein [Gemmatimonadaceae bacterium]
MTHRDDIDCGCQEYNALSRRQFVMNTAGAAVLGTIAHAWLPRVVLAQTASPRDIIVHVFLRGGSDGLSMCVPWGDPNYYTARSTIAIPRPDATGTLKATSLDGVLWGLPPSMLGLLPAYQANQLLIIQGAGLSYSSRSHFDAQRFIEVGKAADPSVSTGWLGRHLATVPPMNSAATLRALSISQGLPNLLEGAPKTLPIPDPANYVLGGSSATRAARQAWLATDYGLAEEPVRSAALDAGATLSLLQSLNISGYAPSNGAVYPNTNFGRGMRSTAALIKANVGVEAVQVDIGGWDTHQTQNPLTGTMATLMTEFANGIGAFWADVLQGNGNYNVTLVAMSEFGRNVRENGSQGTDHGRGSAMFVMGKQIAGGRVYTKNWQPLARENLQDGQDVRVTVDHRDVLAEIVRNRLNNPNLDLIFPAYTPTFQGVTR